MGATRPRAGSLTAVCPRPLFGTVTSLVDLLFWQGLSEQVRVKDLARGPALTSDGDCQHYCFHCYQGTDVGGMGQSGGWWAQRRGGALRSIALGSPLTLGALTAERLCAQPGVRCGLQTFVLCKAVSLFSELPSLLRLALSCLNFAVVRLGCFLALTSVLTGQLG